MSYIVVGYDTLGNFVQLAMLFPAMLLSKGRCCFKFIGCKVLSVVHILL